MGFDLDLDSLVNAVTQEIMRRLNSGASQTVLVTDGCPEAVVAEGYEVAKDYGGGYDYVLLTACAYSALKGGVVCSASPTAENGAKESVSAAAAAKSEGAIIDLTEKRLLHERDLRDHNTLRGDVVNVSKRTIITALAHDYAKSIGVKIVRVD